MFAFLKLVATMNIVDSGLTIKECCEDRYDSSDQEAKRTKLGSQAQAELFRLGTGICVPDTSALHTY